MTKKIIPSAYLEYCPLCGQKLKLNNEIGGRPTKCEHCDFIEPGGAAAAITFISSVMSNYAEERGIDTIYAEDTPLTTTQAFHGETFLPMLVEKAYQIRFANGMSGDAVIDQIGIMPIKCDHSAFGQRVAMTVQDINISQTLYELINAFEEWVSLSKELKLTQWGNEIKIPESTELSKMSSMLVVASTQQQEEQRSKNEPK